MGRPAGSVDKNQRTRGWSIDQLKYLQQNFYKLSAGQIAKDIGKSVKVVKVTAKELGLYKFGCENPSYTIQEAIEKYKNISGVYYLINSVNRRIYIGSSEDIGYRIKYHLGRLQNNHHQCIELQNDWNKKHEIKFRLCKEVIGKDKQVLEQRMIERLINSGILYNKTSNCSLLLKDLSQDRIDEFWKKIDKKSDNECWNWLGIVRRKDGYGVLSINYREVGAHRVAYLLHNKEIQHGLHVCHSCHNKLCCNPHHLYLGDAKINCNDYKHEYIIHSNWKQYEAFGETKTLPQWAKDDRCKVEIHTLQHRIYKKNWDFIKALTTPPRLQAKFNCLYKINEEIKTLKEWSKDSKCEIGYVMLSDRIRKDKINLVCDNGVYIININYLKLKSKRNNIKIYKLNNEEKTLKEWSKDNRCKVKYSCLYNRIKKQGLSLEDAMKSYKPVINMGE